MIPAVSARRKPRRLVCAKSATNSGVSASHPTSGCPNLGKLNARRRPENAAAA
jgi:hypothetical protein